MSFFEVREWAIDSGTHPIARARMTGKIAPKET
jgi:hypothetical protein